MNEELANLMFGIIFLVLIINSTMLAAISSSLYSPDRGEDSVVSPPVTTPPVTSAPQYFQYPALASSADPDPVKPLVSLIPTVVPLGNTGAAVYDTGVILTSSETKPVIESVSSYVTVEPKKSREVETHTYIQPTTAQRYEEGYVTIYSLANQKVSQVLPLISFSLLNPPLVVDYNITPVNTVDVKYMVYKEVSTVYQENVPIVRPYEDAWFEIIVRNKDTGKIVTEDGVGRTYSFQAPRQLVLRECGNYSFEFTGGFANLDLSIKVKEDGNFP